MPPGPMVLPPRAFRPWEATRVYPILIRMRRLTILAALSISVFLAAPARSQPVAATLLAYSQLRQVIMKEGPHWGLASRPDGTVALHGRVLSHAQVERLARFFDHLPLRNRDFYLVRALSSQMSCGGRTDSVFSSGLAVMGKDEDWRLTPLGRSVLIDLLTAEDGVLYRQSQTLQQRMHKLWQPPKKLGAGRAPSAEDLDAFYDNRRIPAEDSAVDGRAALHLDGLTEAGLDGRGTVIGFIDTGLDRTHPDFKDRVAVYQDFTGKGGADRLGHGTHVASLAAGSGSADSRFRGVAPASKLAVFKIVDSEADFDDSPAVQRELENRMLAAMRNAAALPPGQRPHVLNISLGGRALTLPDPVTELANQLVVRDNILVVAAAGNAGPDQRTIGSPGDGEYVLAVTGLDDKGSFPEYASRGYERTADGVLMQKPDLATYAGTSQVENGASAGVIGAQSRDAETSARVPGSPMYRRMSGTSQATPFAAGAAAAAIGQLIEDSIPFRAAEIRALLMESAVDQQWDPVIQGAGLFDGRRMAVLLQKRIEAGMPVGNIACMLTMRLTASEKKSVDASKRYRRTGLGVVDTQGQRLVNTDAELRTMLRQLKPVKTPVLPKHLRIPAR